MDKKEREMIEKAVELKRTRADNFIKQYSKLVSETKAMLCEYQEGLDYWKAKEHELQNGKD